MVNHIDYELFLVNMIRIDSEIFSLKNVEQYDPHFFRSETESKGVFSLSICILFHGALIVLYKDKVNYITNRQYTFRMKNSNEI